jgi:hypothetical protein
MSPIYGKREDKAFKRLCSKIVKRDSQPEKLLQVSQNKN